MLVYVDDILVYNKTLDDHFSHVAIVLNLLKSNTLYAKKTKCCFGVFQVEYIGHFISGDGVSTDPRKVEAVVRWSVHRHK